MTSALLFFAWIVLPYLLLALGYAVALHKLDAVAPPWRALFRYPLFISFTATAAFAIWGFHTISTSRSSTAAIGYVFLPFYSFAVATASLVVSWAVCYLARFAYERLGRAKGRLTITSHALFIVALAIVTIAGNFAFQKFSRHHLLAEAREGEPRLVLFDQALAKQDVELLTALAENPKTPQGLLGTLAMNSSSSVRVGVAKNASTPPKVLEILGLDDDQSVRSWVSMNHRSSEALLKRLAQDPDEHVRSYAQANLHRLSAQPQTP